MPNTNQHLSAAKAARRQHRTVNYVNVKGSTVTALVVGGSGATLDLRVPHIGAGNREKTNIAKRTAMTQTNVWFN